MHNPNRIPRQAEPELMDLPAEAQAYAAADFSEVNAAFVERLVALAEHREQAAVLDLGTGPADIPIRLLAYRPQWEMTAMDGAQAMLDLARRRLDGLEGAARIRLVLADAKNTGLPEASFDVLMSNSLLHHVTDTGALWREVRRLARPRALVFFRDLARPATADDARQIVRRYAGGDSTLLQEEYYRSLLSAYTVEEARQQLRQAGLASLNVDMISDRHFDIWGAVETGYVEGER